ncbi:hypothetical protein Scep_019833 [Stephania cephalantha]|uniref:Uncharacterized protein n=1 Tax=Stephania cephalantha TaxID=152367 RepID=A0AAP0NNC6_9MAGN
MLIGADPTHVDDRCICVTIHHCFFFLYGTRQRHPRLRYGKVHLYNIYSRNWGVYAVCASVESQIYSRSAIYMKQVIRRQLSNITQRSSYFAEAPDKEEASCGCLRSEGDMFLCGAEACVTGAERVFHPCEYYPTWTVQAPEEALKEVLPLCAGWLPIPRPAALE